MIANSLGSGTKSFFSNARQRLLSCFLCMLESIVGVVQKYYDVSKYDGIVLGLPLH